MLFHSTPSQLVQPYGSTTTPTAFTIDYNLDSLDQAQTKAQPTRRRVASSDQPAAHRR